MQIGTDESCHESTNLLQVLPELVETCRSHGMTDIVMVHEHRGEPDGLVISHLPYGPTAYFGVFNVVGLHKGRLPYATPLCCASSSAAPNRWFAGSLTCDCRSHATTLGIREQWGRCQRRIPTSSLSTLARSWEHGCCTLLAV